MGCPVWVYNICFLVLLTASISALEDEDACVQLLALNVPVDELRRSGSPNYGVQIHGKDVLLSDKPDHFRMVDGGLLDVHGTVAFESVTHPGQFLRQKNYKFFLQKKNDTSVFRKDSTFSKIKFKNYSSLFAFELKTHPSWFLSHSETKPFKLLLKKVNTTKGRALINSAFIVKNLRCSGDTSHDSLNDNENYEVKERGVARSEVINIDDDSSDQVHTEVIDEGKPVIHTETDEDNANGDDKETSVVEAGSPKIHLEIIKPDQKIIKEKGSSTKVKIETFDDPRLDAKDENTYTKNDDDDDDDGDDDDDAVDLEFNENHDENIKNSKDIVGYPLEIADHKAAFIGGNKHSADNDDDDDDDDDEDSHHHDKHWHDNDDDDSYDDDEDSREKGDDHDHDPDESHKKDEHSNHHDDSYDDHDDDDYSRDIDEEPHQKHDDDYHEYKKPLEKEEHQNKKPTIDLLNVMKISQHGNHTNTTSFKGGECEDHFPAACKEWAARHYCLAFSPLMKKYCKQACKTCAGNVTVTAFTSCNKDCGGGAQYRMVKVHNKMILQKRSCNSHPCPIDGQYTEFGNFSECSVSCDEGLQFRHRTCTNPAPKHGGKNCQHIGGAVQTRICSMPDCPGYEHYEKKPKCSTNSYSVADLDKRFGKFHIHDSGEMVYDKNGVSVDTTSSIIKSSKGPYQIKVVRGKNNKLHISENCIESDVPATPEEAENEDRDMANNMGSTSMPTEQHQISQQNIQENLNNQENYNNIKSYGGLDEYKYEENEPPGISTFDENKPFIKQEEQLIAEDLKNSLTKSMAQEVKDETQMIPSGAMASSPSIETQMLEEKNLAEMEAKYQSANERAQSIMGRNRINMNYPLNYLKRSKTDGKYHHQSSHKKHAKQHKHKVKTTKHTVKI